MLLPSDHRAIRKNERFATFLLFAHSLADSSVRLMFIIIDSDSDHPMPKKRSSLVSLLL